MRHTCINSSEVTIRRSSKACGAATGVAGESDLPSRGGTSTRKARCRRVCDATSRWRLQDGRPTVSRSGFAASAVPTSLTRSGCLRQPLSPSGRWTNTGTGADIRTVSAANGFLSTRASSVSPRWLRSTGDLADLKRHSMLSVSGVAVVGSRARARLRHAPRERSPVVGSSIGRPSRRDCRRRIDRKCGSGG